jgi:hypothetical protein
MKVHFEGFWQCRMSTDPDPTLELRGTSGYTVALPREGDFDRVIRTQRDQIPENEFREPFPPYLATLPDGTTKRPFGAAVTRVENAPNQEIVDLLQGAEFRLLNNPRFESRNQIVGDGINRIAPPIVPFCLQIGVKDTAYLRRSDPLDPKQPELEIWQLAPSDFHEQVPVTYRHRSDEVVDTIFPPAEFTDNPNVTFNSHFNLRRLTLKQKLSAPNVDPLAAAGYRTRIRMIDSNTSTDISKPGLIENRLGLQCIWDHDIRGKDAFVSDKLATIVDLEKHWRIRFGMGGWDGDLLVGWTSGCLKLPLMPDLRDGK